MPDLGWGMIAAYFDEPRIVVTVWDRMRCMPKAVYDRGSL